MMFYRATVLIGLLGVASTFWLYSRFTVDDAFITWRYGKNLIEYGIWNYSPSHLDLTQAYTNPIFAALSILPPKLDFDVVLFFKIFGLVNLFAFVIWYARQTKGSYVTLLLLLGMPATIVHVFGGLETFLYVSLMSALFVALDKNNKSLSIGLALALFLTRPESWLLAALLPLFFLFKESPGKLDSSLLNQFFAQFRHAKPDIASAITVGAALIAPLLLYLFLNKAYFGYALPNSFYAKSGAFFSIDQFITLSFFISPLLLLVLYGKSKIFLLTSAYSMALALNYSMSNLQMDYSARFAFHIFVPIFVFLVYISTTYKGHLKLELNNIKIANATLETITKGFAVLFLLVLLKISGMVDAHMVTYYPRALDSHAALGKTLAQIRESYKLQSFALGDAGIAAYHSGLRALDNVGLGSALVTHEGLNSVTMDSYNPDLIAFHSRPNEIRLKDHNQAEIFKWATARGFNYVCDIYWQSDYTLKLYSRTALPELRAVCEASKAKNDRNNRSYLKSSWSTPPWHYWKE